MRFLVILFALLSIVSCAPDSGSRDVLDVAVSQEPPTFDVHVNSSQIARYVMAGNVFERLVTLNGEGRAVPELCSSFEPVNGSRGWIFHLREGVRFHNGRIMTSEDVVLSMNRWIEYNAAVASMLDGARFTAVDGNTVRIDAQEPILFLPEMMAGSPQAAVVYAREMFDSLDGDGLVTEYIGTGPYRFVSWERGSSVRLERFEDYCPYGGQMDGLAGFKHAYIPVIIYHFVPDSFARTTGCETGLYDFINDVMNDDIPRLEENDDLVVSRGEEAGSVVILFNKRQGLCADQYVRTAVNMAVDLDVPMAACYGGGGYVMHPDYMEGNQRLWAVTDSEPRYDAGDKEGARKLLNELLGYIYFTGSADLSALKVRLLELIVRLSRAAIDAGAEGREVLIFNENSITQLGKINSADELSSWVTGIMNRFIMYCFDYAKAHHSDVLYKAMQYVKANYREKITLDDVASAIYLSRSYLCKVFKDEMGETLFSYINRIRVEKAKTLILDDSISIADVGGMCGFNDQSYFTKVFKSQTGVSPKKYRERRGRTA